MRAIDGHVAVRIQFGAVKASAESLADDIVMDDFPHDLLRLGFEDLMMDHRQRSIHQREDVILIYWNVAVELITK